LKAQLSDLKQRLLPQAVKEELIQECSIYLAERLATRGKCNRLFGSYVSYRSPFCCNTFPGLDSSGAELTNQQIPSARLRVKMPVQRLSL